MAPSLIDTHAHLDAAEFAGDLSEVIERARRAEVQIISVSTDLDSAEATVELARRYKLRCAVGIHPHLAERYVHDGRFAPESLDRLTGLAQQRQVVAIGEIGLDYYKNYAPREAQLVIFRAQLALARQVELPVVIHLREAALEVLAELRRLPGLRGVIHSFTGDAELAQQIEALGFYLSLNGIVTFGKESSLRQAAQQISLERLLLETDSPYLAPVPWRGKRNEPLYLRQVAEFVAELRGLTPEALAQATSENARRLFGLCIDSR